MSPREAALAVGHSPDIAADLRREIKAGYEFANEPLMEDAAAEIDRLRTALRSVRELLRQARYQTDLGWADQRVSDALEIISNALREDRT
jgi:hypothetical protein